MSKYIALTREHWQKHRPRSYSQLKDPEAFFSSLSEEIEEQVTTRQLAIAGDDPPNESYLDKVGRLTEARVTAESDVLREMLPEPETETNPTLA